MNLTTYTPQLSSKPRGRTPRHIDGLHIIPNGDNAEYYTSSGEVTPGELFGACLGKHLYSSVESVGLLERCFAQIPFEKVQALYQGNAITFNGYRLNRQKGLGEGEFHLTVRKGKASGHIINVPALFPEYDPGSPDEIIHAITELRQFLINESISTSDFHSIGNSAQIAMTPRLRRDYALPPTQHTERFFKSYRGPHHETYVLGTAEVGDYDLNSAYPSAMARLVSMDGLNWRESTSLAMLRRADYVAALVDLEVPRDVFMSPVIVPIGARSYGPVGKLRNIWVNLAEIQLLDDIPELGKITRVHEASYAIGKTDRFYPFAETVSKLYTARKHTPRFAAYVKGMSVAAYGKAIATYEDGTAADCFNPVFASAITSHAYTELVRFAYGTKVINVAVDGFASSDEIETRDGLGGIKLDGKGKATFFNDQYKHRIWHPVADYLRESMNDKDSPYLYGTNTNHRLTIGELLSNGEHHARAGRLSDYYTRERLGSLVRKTCLDRWVRMGDLVNGQVSTRPLTYAESYRREVMGATI